MCLLPTEANFLVTPAITMKECYVEKKWKNLLYPVNINMLKNQTDVAKGPADGTPGTADS